MPPDRATEKPSTMSSAARTGDGAEAAIVQASAKPTRKRVLMPISC